MTSQEMRDKRDAILADLEWVATDILDAKDAIAEAQKELYAARAHKADLRAKLVALKTAIQGV
jgi:septal ring factor EnvC (AmiA/AmiB activator)